MEHILIQDNCDRLYLDGDSDDNCLDLDVGKEYIGKASGGTYPQPGL